MTEQELNERRAKWAGFVKGSWQGWFAPNPDDIYIGDELPDFPHDETACFKWLVPKARKVSGFVLATSYGKDEEYDAIFPDIDSEPSATDKSPAKAICMAIDKLIDSEVKP